MFKSKKKQNIAYGIVGLGRFGQALAIELAESGAEILVLDKDESKVRELRELTENAMVVQSLNKKTLLETGIQNCDVAIVCIGENMESSILTTLNLVSMGISKVIAKATSSEHGEILERLGAEVVYPERDMGIRLARRLETSKVLDMIQLSEKINISKLLVPAHFIGKKIVDLNIRAEFGVNIIAIENNNEVIDLLLPDYAFKKGDVLFISGSKEAVLRLAELDNVR